MLASPASTVITATATTSTTACAFAYPVYFLQRFAQIQNMNEHHTDIQCLYIYTYSYICLHMPFLVSHGIVPPHNYCKYSLYWYVLLIPLNKRAGNWEPGACTHIYVYIGL